ncbi:MAG: aspartoacylase [Candidatus Sericytochromatia bacterium]
MKRVVIVGGTHGNEWGGIYLCHKWQSAPKHWEKYPFRVETYLANPRAIELNRRYLEEDLNRCFRSEDLANHDLSSYEAQRAKVIAQDLSGCDFLIDLHNTTSNMGMSLILSREEALDDPLMLQLCAHLLQQDPLVRIYYMPHTAKDSPYLPSLGQRELTLEVGPMAHGTLRADLFFKTERLVQAMLAFLSDWEQGEAKAYEGELTVYRQIENLDFPRTPAGKIRGMIHPQLYGRDYRPLYPGRPLYMTFDGLVLNYEGDETVWPVFINEQAYYEKGLAMSLTRKEQIPL